MRRNAFVLALAAALSAAVPGFARAADTPVDLELVLAVDVSRSMDPDELQLQRDGYVAALTHPDIIAAIRSGARHRIALSYVEWAGPGMQYTAVDWRAIDGEASARAFADALAQAPIQAFRGTSISDGLAYIQSRFDGNGFAAPRRVIDVSGDGPNNMGMPVELAREAVLRAGITINGLPIMIKQAGGFAAIDNLDVYYQDCVIGGAGAFLLVVKSPDQFAEAIRRKLVLEIADRADHPRHRDPGREPRRLHDRRAAASAVDARVSARGMRE
ncbi:DUF1194 domain-containing protein [Dongia sedimenti]|uniref:DUF1194 domain-containing protein n=1 Tax=Dongia sedimenti TaxID=3064282 RepID=A0ABU0YPF9_9PROT|nr:DUF1194 domain-containing protein [Rhodospirillaceae bacterium R-7]